MEYKIIGANTQHGLNAQVSIYLDQGWRCADGVAVIWAQLNGTTFYQAITKDDI